MYAIIDIGSNTIRLNVYQVRRTELSTAFFKARRRPAWPAMFGRTAP